MDSTKCPTLRELIGEGGSGPPTQTLPPRSYSYVCIHAFQAQMLARYFKLAILVRTNTPIAQLTFQRAHVSTCVRLYFC